MHYFNHMYCFITSPFFIYQAMLLAVPAVIPSLLPIPTHDVSPSTVTLTTVSPDALASSTISSSSSSPSSSISSSSSTTSSYSAASSAASSSPSSSNSCIFVPDANDVPLSNLSSVPDQVMYIFITNNITMHMYTLHILLMLYHALHLTL